MNDPSDYNELWSFSKIKIKNHWEKGRLQERCAQVKYAMKKRSGEEKLSSLLQLCHPSSWSGIMIAWEKKRWQQVPPGVSGPEPTFFSKSSAWRCVWIPFLVLPPPPEYATPWESDWDRGIQGICTCYLEVIGPWKTKHGGRKLFGWNNVDVVGNWNQRWLDVRWRTARSGLKWLVRITLHWNYMKSNWKR